MRRLFEDDAYSDAPLRDCAWRENLTPPDYPQIDGETTCDFAVIGAGFTGLSAALHLGGRDIVVVDAKTPGWGASGRNGGFCCLGGSGLGADDLARKYGREDAAIYHQAERSAVELVAELLAQHGIDADRHSDGETLLAHSPKAFAAMQEEAAHIPQRYGVSAEIIPKGALPEHGMQAQGFHGAMTTPIGFALHPLKYAMGLAQAATGSGARLFANSPVVSHAHANGRHILTTPNGRIVAKTVLFATNGYSVDGLPDALTARFMPIQSNILVSRALTAAELDDQGWTTRQMCYDSRRLLHYFRLLPDNRMMFGMRGSAKATPKAFAAMRTLVRRDFDQMFPAWGHVQTPWFWSGLLALSRRMVPFVGPTAGAPNSFASLCYHGNGVAMATFCGALMARDAMGETTSAPFPKLMRAPMTKYPLGRFRRALLPLAYQWYAIKDGV